LTIIFINGIIWHPVQNNGIASKDEIARLGQLFKVVDAKNRVIITFGDLREGDMRCCTEFGG
jgi:hypothetical protein